jgi:hypothetical protein
MRYRRGRRRRIAVTRAGMPGTRVHELSEYGNGYLLVGFDLNAIVIPAKRQSEFKIGQRFKLVPIK